MESKKGMDEKSSRFTDPLSSIPFNPENILNVKYETKEYIKSLHNKLQLLTT